MWYVWYAIRILVVACVVLVFGSIGFWMQDRSSPTTLLDTVVLTPKVPLRGQLDVQRTVIRHALCHTLIDRAVFDAEGRRFDLGIVAYPNGTGPLGKHTFIRPLQLPDNIMIGKARYIALICYRCNPVQNIWPVCELSEGAEFEVVPRVPFDTSINERRYRYRYPILSE